MKRSRAAGSFERSTVSGTRSFGNENTGAAAQNRSIEGQRSAGQTANGAERFGTNGVNRSQGSSEGWQRFSGSSATNSRPTLDMNKPIVNERSYRGSTAPRAMAEQIAAAHRLRIARRLHRPAIAARLRRSRAIAAILPTSRVLAALRLRDHPARAAMAGLSGGSRSYSGGGSSRGGGGSSRGGGGGGSHGGGGRR